MGERQDRRRDEIVPCVLVKLADAQHEGRHAENRGDGLLVKSHGVGYGQIVQTERLDLLYLELLGRDDPWLADFAVLEVVVPELIASFRRGKLLRQRVHLDDQVRAELGTHEGVFRFLRLAQILGDVAEDHPEALPLPRTRGVWIRNEMQQVLRIVGLTVDQNLITERAALCLKLHPARRDLDHVAQQALFGHRDDHRVPVAIDQHRLNDVLHPDLPGLPAIRIDVNVLRKLVLDAVIAAGFAVAHQMDRHAADQLGDLPHTGENVRVVRKRGVAWDYNVPARFEPDGQHGGILL